MYVSVHCIAILFDRVPIDSPFHHFQPYSSSSLGFDLMLHAHAEWMSAAGHQTRKTAQNTVEPDPHDGILNCGFSFFLSIQKTCLSTCPCAIDQSVMPFVSLRSHLFALTYKIEVIYPLKYCMYRIYLLHISGPVQSWSSIYFGRAEKNSALHPCLLFLGFGLINRSAVSLRNGNAEFSMGLFHERNGGASVKCTLN